MKRAAVALALVALLGCGKPAAPVGVRGAVTYRGFAVRSGVIAFTPDAGRGERGPTVRGTIGSDGAYRLADAPPGWYRVTIATADPVAAGLTLPDALRDPDLSGLVRHVVPGSENVLDFHIEKP